jgi:hypothetical protein
MKRSKFTGLLVLIGLVTRLAGSLSVLMLVPLADNEAAHAGPPTLLAW